MRGSPLRWTLRGLLAALFLVLAWTAVVLLSVRDDLAAAEDALEAARAAEAPATALPPLAQAERDLRRVSSRLDQPGPALARAMPLVGQTVRAVHVTTAAALAVTTGTREVLAAVETGGPLLAGGRVDLARLGELQRALAEAATGSDRPVARLRGQSLRLVPQVVAGPARTARAELTTVPEQLAQAAAGLEAVAHVLGADGPQDLLVVLENNAELRGTGGIVTVFAEATTDDGRLTIRDFQDVEDVADPAAEARPVPAPPDFVALYGPFKANTTLWKNTNMSPDVPTSSRVLAEVAAASTGRRPDAIVWLDVRTIAAVLRATGPARLPDGTLLRAEDAVTRLLSTAYREAPDSSAGQAQRRSALRAAADAVLGDLLGGGSPSTSPGALAQELLGAAQGRHLALWSADAATQRALLDGRLAGAVQADGGDLSALTSHNLGGGDADGNKLDFYGRRQTTLSATVGRDGAQVQQDLAVRNTAPPRGLPVYVAGRVTPGVSNSLVTISVPSDAQQLTLVRDGQPLAVQPRPEGDHMVLTDVVGVPPGQTVSWRVRYRLPVDDGTYRLTLYPQPLAVDAGLSLRVDTAPGLRLRSRYGSPVGSDGAVSLSGPFSEVTRLEVTAQQPGGLTRALHAFRRFWSEPVSLP